MLKNISAILVLLMPIFFSPQILLAQQNNAAAANLNFLKQYKGKYPGDVKLFANAALKKRLQKLLGTEFNYPVKSIIQVETPIKVENNFFYVWAMQAHSGGDPSATILADISKNVLYVKIIKDAQTKIYAEDGSDPIPKDLENWSRKQSSN
jgi:hypothetical protein